VDEINCRLDNGLLTTSNGFDRKAMIYISGIILHKFLVKFIKLWLFVLPSVEGIQKQRTVNASSVLAIRYRRYLLLVKKMSLQVTQPLR
jgi:hypothetical protein